MKKDGMNSLKKKYTKRKYNHSTLSGSIVNSVYKGPIIRTVTMSLTKN